MNDSMKYIKKHVKWAGEAISDCDFFEFHRHTGQAFAELRNTSDTFGNTKDVRKKTSGLLHKVVVNMPIQFKRRCVCSKKGESSECEVFKKNAVKLLDDNLADAQKEVKSMKALHKKGILMKKALDISVDVLDERIGAVRHLASVVKKMKC